MSTMYELALQLSQASEHLQQQASRGEWEALPATQQQRAHLLTQLQHCAEPRDTETLTAVRQLLEHARSLERLVQEQVTREHRQLGQAHNQLQRNQQASKAYGRFS